MLTRGLIKGTLLCLAIGLTMTIVMLVAAEYMTRFVFRNARSSGNARAFVAQRGGGVAIHVNTMGYRDREVPPKTAGRYRIAVIGDSFTFGQGVEEPDRYSNLLQDRLGARFEVFNFGRSGNNMPEHLEVLTQVLGVHPDFVLLQLYINDFETAAMERPRPYPLLPEPANGRMERASMLYDLAAAQW